MSYFFQLKDISNQDTFSFSLPSYHFAQNLSDSNGSILKKNRWADSIWETVPWNNIAQELTIKSDTKQWNYKIFHRDSYY